MEIARRQLNAGKRHLHIVAPPGSGKTILGLYLWAELVKKPALVLSPNSAIQAQWADKLALFKMEAGAEQPGQSRVSLDPEAPGWLTSLTYQSVTIPRRTGTDLETQAFELWQNRLVEKGQAKDPEEAQAWIEDLARHNPDYHEQRFAAYRKEVRDLATLSGNSLPMLHASAQAALRRLREQGLGLIILDECHHLLGHWGRVLADAHELFDQPLILGLTATPPDPRGRLQEDLDRYSAFFGPVDYEVPVPAVVKDGFLAPYQDLVQFVRPTSEELKFIACADDELHRLVAELCHSPPAAGTASGCGESLPDWLHRVLAERLLPTGIAKDWPAFEIRDPAFAKAARLFLLRCQRELPATVPEPDQGTPWEDIPEMHVLVPVLDRYVRHRLRNSPEPADQALAERVISRLRMLGIQITETGCQACASPVGRVLAYSRAKTTATLAILRAEQAALGRRIRAVVVTDYEKTSAVSSEITHLLDDEAGGAVAVFRALLADPETDGLDPVLLTGSTVLVDDDLAPPLLDAARAWLTTRGCKVELRYIEEEGFHVLQGSGADWCPQTYVMLVTELFQRGLTRCLVGTRGLLGEGWDAHTVNVLIDLTTVTTSMSVNQLRGRSLRLDPDDPAKLSDNWDVVCIAPEFARGLDDYERFINRHKVLFGLTDDGVIEKGVGHVHAAFTELKPELVETSVLGMNEEMLARVHRRADFRERWHIGEPYYAEPIHAVEARLGGAGGGFPPFAGMPEAWEEHSLTTAIGEAVLGALREAKLIQPRGELHSGDRAGGYVRLFLKHAPQSESEFFARALHEALGPLHRPRYLIPRSVDLLKDTWLSRILPGFIGQHFRRRERQLVMWHAVPSDLAKNKELADLYQRHWNIHVSPGEVLYAHHGEGERTVTEARRIGLAPSGRIHSKEVFL